MKVRIAYIEEPPFYWTGDNRVVTGADIEVAEVVLRAIGVTSIEYHLTSFGELLPGVQEGRWDMNVPIFVTAERARHVAFSMPIWTVGDGFVVRSGNPKALTSYAAVAARSDARLGLIPEQVQFAAAKSAGVSDSQIMVLKDQPEGVAALMAGDIDAFPGTALGSRSIADANHALEAVALDADGSSGAPVGAFSFAKSNHDLRKAVNGRLRQYLGTPDHRARIAKYGFTQAEIDGVIGPGGGR